jgi:hypothetical protein
MPDGYINIQNYWHIADDANRVGKAQHIVYLFIWVIQAQQMGTLK